VYFVVSQNVLGEDLGLPFPLDKAEIKRTNSVMTSEVTHHIALTSDFRSAANNLLRQTTPPRCGQGLPFMTTSHPRLGNGGRNSRTLSFLFL